MKKWFIPVLYFIFGIIIYLLEDFGLALINEASVSLRNFLNLMNLILFIIIPVITVVLMYKKGLIIFQLSKLNIVYVIYSIISFILISMFWINTIQWK